jgi:23S rRNA (uridine2552-2'-O)-methyltransferase
VTITDTGSEGDGIAKIGGYTVFVPGSTVNETLQIEIVRAQPNYAHAEPVDGAKTDDIAV